MWIVPLIRWSSNCIDVNCQNSEFENIPRPPLPRMGDRWWLKWAPTKAANFHHLGWKKKKIHLLPKLPSLCQFPPPGLGEKKIPPHGLEEEKIPPPAHITIITETRHLVEPRGTSVSWILFTRLNRIQCKIGGYNAVKKPRYPGQPLLDLCNEGPTLIACQNFTRHTTVTLWMSSSQ